MTELQPDVDVLTVPIAARCFRGCGRFADIRVDTEQYCARCYQEAVEERHRKENLERRERKASK